jgi:hypothetical protein
MRSGLVVLALAALCASAAVAQGPTPAPGEAVDFELESSLTGGRSRLSSLRPRVVVLFYEDREHVAQNEELKGNLERFIADNHLEREMVLQPVANGDGYDYAPANGLVRGALGEASRRMGLDILIDWNRALHAAPFHCRSGASNVLVIDRGGRITFRHAGAVGEAERSQLYRAIRGALRSPR